MLFEVVVCVALRRDDRWLLSVRGPDVPEPDTIGLVGGHLEAEPAELPDVLEVSARREVLEETGVDLTGVVLDYLDSELFSAASGAPVLAVTFAAELPAAATPALAAPAELTEVGWWTLPELAADPRCPPWTLRLCRLAEQRLVR